MSFVAKLIKNELKGDVSGSSTQKALEAYRESLTLGFSKEEAITFSEAVYKIEEEIELKKDSELIKSIDKGQLVYTLITDDVQQSSSNLLTLIQEKSELKIPEVKSLITSDISKGGLTRDQALQLQLKLSRAGGKTYIQSKGGGK